MRLPPAFDEDAVTRGRTWESARIWIVGHIALVQVIVLHGGLSDRLEIVSISSPANTA
jgi:hypothetical protein